MNIKQKIKKQGFTISQVAALMKGRGGATGITQSSLSQLISGNPSIDKLQEIADIIGISLSDLVSDDDKAVPFLAVVYSNGVTYTANSLVELKRLTEMLSTEALK